MTPRTQTRAPLDDRSYWRRLKAAVHPDREAGDHDLFVFLAALEEHVRSCLNGYGREAPYRTNEPSSPATETERVPYDHQLGDADEFVKLTLRAISVGQRSEEPYRSVLALLFDCPAHEHGRPVLRQCRGASYRQLALIAHRLGWSKSERVRWYDLARAIPLSEAHASHLIDRLKETNAA
jgi:hypothetical protein